MKNASLISTDERRVKVRIIPTDEALMMARSALQLTKAQQ
jgi:acetate kinase